MQGRFCSLVTIRQVSFIADQITMRRLDQAFILSLEPRLKLSQFKVYGSFVSE